MISKKSGTRAAGQVEATVACPLAKPTTTAVLNRLTTVRAAHIKAEDILIGARREVDMVNKTTITATRVTGVDTLHLQEDGCHLRPVLRASAPACRPHLRWPNTTVTVVVMAEAINRATAMVADTAPRLHLLMVADNIRVEAEVDMGEDIKGKGIGSHHHRAAMIAGTEVEEAAAVMAVIGDTIGDMATIKGMVTAVATVVEAGDVAPKPIISAYIVGSATVLMYK